MPDSLTVRRTEFKLPSRRKHALAALALVSLIALMLFTAVKLMGEADDAVAGGKLAVAAMPLPPMADSLNGSSDALPDLLQGEVAMNENPTEKLDALGNPIASSGATPDTQMSGTPEIIIEPIPSTQSGPKTIMIDGKAIGGAASAPSPLPRAPIAGLSRMSAYGRVPAPAPDGRKAVTAYARPATVRGQRTVSVIVGGLGVNAPVTRRAISELPADVTLSFAAHSQNLQNWINQARARGHEVLIELPMESAAFNASEPGADRTLLSSAGSAENIRNLDWLLSRGQGYFGVTNYNGDSFVTRADAAAPVLSHLSNAGLGFIYDGSASAPSLRPLAGSANLPFASGFSLIDTQTDSASIDNELSRLAASASNGAGPIGVGFAYPQTIDAINRWAADLQRQGIVLAPASHALSSR